MEAWPNIAHPSLPFQEEPTDPTIRTKTEGGYTQTRPRCTRITRAWQLVWPAMTNDHFSALRSFYDRMRGGSVSFTWTSPANGITYIVRFGGKISAEIAAWNTDETPKYWAVRASLEEV